ncbi:MAG: hypothetical protein GY866_04670 [Proteobacteria bacterium]|nr:hypothetical protein [Pseudomonadota bacterium]
MTFLFGCLVFIGGHEASVRYRQDVTCTVCHEMAEPIEKWQASGTAKNHSNCAGCHYNSGIAGWLEMNLSAARFLVGHFSRPAEEPIQPMVEPLFLDEEKEPGYWSRVPNHRCFQCHDALNHRREDQQTVHGEMVRDVLAKPCMDCHNHEMRNGQPFYEKVLVKR